MAPGRKPPRRATCSAPSAKKEKRSPTPEAPSRRLVAGLVLLLLLVAEEECVLLVNKVEPEDAVFPTLAQEGGAHWVVALFAVLLLLLHANHIEDFLAGAARRHG